MSLPALIWAPVLAAVGAFLIILILTPFSKRLGLLDLPDERKRHGEPVPMVGGIAIFMSILVVTQIYPLGDQWRWLLAGSALLVLVGVLDDVFDLGVRSRLAAQLVATAAMIWGAGIVIVDLGTIAGYPLQLGYLGVALTLFAVVALTNAFNMVDGIDGLASGHALVALASIAIAQSLVSDVHNYAELAIIFAATLAFWLVNMTLTPLKKVFLGDAGSLVLGFMIAWLLVRSSQGEQRSMEPVMTLWCVAVPILDTVLVVANRLRKGRSPFAPDRGHIHHVLIDSGVPRSRALALMLLGGALLNVAGLYTVAAFGQLTGLLLFGFSSAGLIVCLNHGALHKWLGTLGLRADHDYKP